MTACQTSLLLLDPSQQHSAVLSRTISSHDSTVVRELLPLAHRTAATAMEHTAMAELRQRERRQHLSGRRERRTAKTCGKMVHVVVMQTALHLPQVLQQAASRESRGMQTHGRVHLYPGVHHSEQTVDR